MKLRMVVIGIVFLVIGGIIDAVGFAEFSRCSNIFLSTCDLGFPIGLIIFGGVLSFAGIMVTILGAAVHLRGPTLPQMPTPILKETVITKEVLIQCRSCGARYTQGTLKCLTCGASL